MKLFPGGLAIGKLSLMHFPTIGSRSERARSRSARSRSNPWGPSASAAVVANHVLVLYDAPLNRTKRAVARDACIALRGDSS